MADPEYEAVRSAVYRKLDGFFPDSLMALHVQQEAADKFPALKKWIESLPEGHVRRAYLYWFPHFEKKFADRVRGTKEYARSKAIEHTVPGPFGPSTPIRNEDKP